MGVSNVSAKWIGWPGVAVEEGPDRDALTAALAKENYIPVYLDANTVRCQTLYCAVHSQHVRRHWQGKEGCR